MWCGLGFRGLGFEVYRPVGKLQRLGSQGAGLGFMGMEIRASGDPAHPDTRARISPIPTRELDLNLQTLKPQH